MVFLDGLRCFLEVCSSLSIRRAAKRLFISPSALSRKMARLERELGVELFSRDGGRLTITPAGHIVRHLAYAVLGVVDCVAAMTYRDGTDVSYAEGQIMWIGVSPFIGPLPLRSNPRRKVCFVQEDPTVLIRMVGDLLLEGAVVTQLVDTLDGQAVPTHDSLVSNGLTAIQIDEKPLLLVGAPPILDRLCGATTLASVSGFPFVLPSPSVSSHHLLKKALISRWCLPNLVAMCRDQNALLDLLAAGIGLSLLSLDAADKHPGISTLSVVDPPVMRRTYIVFRQNRRTPLTSLTRA